MDNKKMNLNSLLYVVIVIITCFLATNIFIRVLDVVTLPMDNSCSIVLTGKVDSSSDGITHWTRGPAFPSEMPTSAHIHFLEQDDTVGIFSFNLQNNTWEKIGSMPVNKT